MKIDEITILSNAKGIFNKATASGGETLVERHQREQLAQHHLPFDLSLKLNYGFRDCLPNAITQFMLYLDA